MCKYKNRKNVKKHVNVNGKSNSMIEKKTRNAMFKVKRMKIYCIYLL